jgi:HD superfamily phosphohydrolase
MPVPLGIGAKCPLYNYISLNLEKDKDAWLLKLLDTPEVQRLRRVHVLGLSSLTYNGADHNRLAHSLGVLHLMFEALRRIAVAADDAQVTNARASLLAAALLHDVGHGPFSHVFEPCLGVDHEVWSERVILGQTPVNEILRGVDEYLPRKVADLMDAGNHTHPAWQKFLISSQLDVDRLDYLRRDSLFTGAGFGHFDYFRILNTFEFHEAGGNRGIVWPEKSALAIEEYIFARYHMYQNVYLHKTTRGFEKMVVAMWQRARRLHAEGTDVCLIPPIRDFWAAGENASIGQYLAVEEFTVLYQIQQWAGVKDSSLNDLARRFLARNRFAVVDPPSQSGELAPDLPGWKTALLDVVTKKGYAPPEMYCLEDTIKAKYNSPYVPEKEGDEQTVKNAIRIKVPGEPQPVEIVKLRPRLEPLTAEAAARVRYYVPKDAQADAIQLRTHWKRSP